LGGEKWECWTKAVAVFKAHTESLETLVDWDLSFLLSRFKLELQSQIQPTATLGLQALEAQCVCSHRFQGCLQEGSQALALFTLESCSAQPAGLLLRVGSWFLSAVKNSSVVVEGQRQPVQVS
jgi:hypothetical protein